ncbi:MAG: peptide chain release factor 1 [Candidatus Lokiarchaeota archaeon]|nr:peptide chain release factor 1 [Candidatus Lokiarchaeota archaeon]
MVSVKKLKSFKLYQLKKKIMMLREKKGYHTALISLYVPNSKNISDVTNYLKSEYGQAQNIKSKSNRKNVMDAITSIIAKLKMIKSIPEEGLAIFVGAIPTNGPGTEKMESYIILPPENINTFRYYCSSEFYLEPLEDMLTPKNVYGLVVIDRSGATFATLQGSTLNIKQNLTSGVPGKHGKGGQSQRRFERLIEQAADEFFTRAGEHMDDIFLPLLEGEEGNKLEGIIIGGGGPTKEKFASGDYFDYRLKDKILSIVDVGYSDEAGIKELIEKSQKLLENLQYMKERELVQEFINHIAKDDGLAIYGEEAVRKHLKMGAIDTVLVSENLDIRRVIVECENCGWTEKETMKSKKLDGFEDKISDVHCPKCNSSLVSITEDLDLIEDLGTIAEDMGSDIEIISADTEEGGQFWSGFGGIGAILRYRVGDF